MNISASEPSFAKGWVMLAVKLSSGSELVQETLN